MSTTMGVEPKVVSVNHKLIPFSLMPSQDDPNAVLPTTISISVQKLAILAYFEASS